MNKRLKCNENNAGGMPMKVETICTREMIYVDCGLASINVVMHEPVYYSQEILKKKRRNDKEQTHNRLPVHCPTILI